MQTNPVRRGFILGLFLAFWHACWAGLVASGFAQPVIDFVFWAHFLNSPFAIQPFEPLRALALVGLTFSIGLVMGIIAALFWNMLARRPASN